MGLFERVRTCLIIEVSMSLKGALSITKTKTGQWLFFLLSQDPDIDLATPPPAQSLSA